jgi:hypothetical protein
LKFDSEIQNKQTFSSTKRRIEVFIVDATLIKAGSKLVWLWISIDIKRKENP